LNFDTILLIVSDSIEFECINEINRCGILQKECGVGLLVSYTTEAATIVLTGRKYPGYSPSIWLMLEIGEVIKTLNDEEAIISIEI
jgi:hypothetical protein